MQSSNSSTSESDEWVEKELEKRPRALTEREDWMSMTGVLKTYTKDDLKPKQEVKDKKHIDSYNPATSSRELNPYWKDGGTGVPETAESFRKRRTFVKPSNHDDFYTKPSSSRESSHHRDDRTSSRHDRHNDREFKSRRSRHEDESYNQRKSWNWKRSSEQQEEKEVEQPRQETRHTSPDAGPSKALMADKPKDTKYLSDEKMNKLGAKIIKAEILGDTKLVEELRAKLEAAREYRKQNPDAGKEEEEGVMLIATNSAGNSMPLAKGDRGDPRSKGGKRKVDTHMDGQRAKYFGNDDKYSLSQMVSLVKIWLCIL